MEGAAVLRWITAVLDEPHLNGVSRNDSGALRHVAA